MYYNKSKGIGQTYVERKTFVKEKKQSEETYLALK